MVTCFFLARFLSCVDYIGSDLDERLRIHHLGNCITLIMTSWIKFDTLIILYSTKARERELSQARSK
jgi:hypothetical protein